MITKQAFRVLVRDMGRQRGAREAGRGLWEGKSAGGER